MVLVDRDIKALVQNGLLISENYKPENLGSVSYDLTIDNIISEEDIAEEYVLKPKEFVIVKTNEELNIPVNMIGKIEEKNSLLRLGLFVSGPVYQPGRIQRRRGIPEELSGRRQGRHYRSFRPGLLQRLHGGKEGHRCLPCVGQ